MQKLQRTCIGCNIKKDKGELLRVVKNKSGQINIDESGKMDGRGSYICKNENCLNKAIKNKRMSKSFGIEIDNQIYDKIRKFINGGDFIG